MGLFETPRDRTFIVAIPAAFVLIGIASIFMSMGSGSQEKPRKMRDIDVRSVVLQEGDMIRIHDEMTRTDTLVHGDSAWSVQCGLLGVTVKVGGEEIILADGSFDYAQCEDRMRQITLYLKSVTVSARAGSAQSPRPSRD